VVAVETVNQAKQLYEDGDLLGGERFCKKIMGFDFGNSPLEYLSDAVAGKRLIITTTNGTRAIYKSQKAQHVLAGSMLNAKACAEVMQKLKRDVVIVCAGTQSEFALEDGLCTGLLIEELSLRQEEEMQLDDFGLAMHNAYRHVQERLEDTLMQCANGIKLNKMGLRDDVVYCAQTNQTTIVPILRDHKMVPF
jgi:2-phosphosulfolactate phosphatase